MAISKKKKKRRRKNEKKGKEDSKAELAKKSWSGKVTLDMVSGCAHHCVLWIDIPPLTIRVSVESPIR